MNNRLPAGGAAIEPTPLLAQIDVLAGRADQCSDLAQWLDINGYPGQADQLRNVAAILSDEVWRLRRSANAGAVPRREAT